LVRTAGLLAAVVDFPLHGRLLADHSPEPLVERDGRERWIDGPNDDLPRRIDGGGISRAVRILAKRD
jgi:hypothetical protein